MGAPHDFIFGQTAVEIKYISGSYADSVKISTESQLTTHLETLHLRIVFLAVDMDCKTGLSLNDFITLHLLHDNLQHLITHGVRLDTGIAEDAGISRSNARL